MTREEQLAAAPSMRPVQGTVDVDIPIDVLWDFFRHANLWSRWNKCFLWALNKDLVLGRQLIWCFQPIKWYLPYKMPAIAKIVEVEERKKVTWEVTALLGFYARHTYHMEDLGGGRSRFGSYEKAMGWSFPLTKWFWIKHFTFVKDESLKGAQKLDAIYREKNRLDETVVPKIGLMRRLLGISLLVLALAAGVFVWFYLSFVRQTYVQLSPGITAVLGGGGNSLVVEEEGQALVIDTKFWPGSVTLHDWIVKDHHEVVRTVINTHYHYDHTRGNYLYSGAQIIAFHNVPELMREQPQDRQYCEKYPAAVPTVFVNEENHDAASAKVVFLGATELRLFHPGVAHTHGDICVYLPRTNVVVTGDLLFFTYYPFIDVTPGGASLQGMVAALRKLADDFPTATFMPGHGKLATARDLRNYASYLEDLDAQVRKSMNAGLSESQTVKAVDLSKWHRHILPSFPNDRIWPEWATQSSNVRSAYELAVADRPSAPATRGR